MKINDYARYIAIPFTNKPLMIFAYINSIFFAFIDRYLGISFAILGIYLLLAVIDLITGIYYNIIVNKEIFKSELFLKKLLSIIMAIIGILALNLFAKEVLIKENSIELINQFNQFLSYIFSVAKIFLVVAFVGYELTSIRENTNKLKWNSVSNVIDLIILPITKIKNILQNRINETANNSNNTPAE